MSNSTAQVLMKKGKRGAAAYIHADCASGPPQHLGPLLDVLLNPSKAIDEWETIDWCRWLIAGGRTPDEFATVVRSYDKHDKCGLVWIPRVVAYRCRTCGISPCMSICRECFHRGDHSTHDFNMFLSQAGGACDCGDNSVMKEDGFCSNHGNKCPRPGTAPAELMCVAEAMMPRLILRLLQHFRENSWGSATNSDSYRRAVNECEGYVNMLMELNNMGDLMRSAMTKALINPQMYRNLVEPPFPQTEYGQYMAESKKMYEKAIETFPAPEPPDEYKHLPALSPHLQHNTLLDEFIFWTFKYEFPQNIVCFLLNMLPDQDYKEHLTRTFVLHYARIPLVLEAAADPDTLSNRVVHMSVQLFSNEALALRCVEQLHLLHVMVLSLKMMMGKILVQNTLHDPEKNFHYVIDCTRRVMKEHCYWPLVSDFNNVLSHGRVALLFLQDDDLLDMWFEFLSMLQGMNVNVRETSGHIEFEPSSYYAAFSCELEAAAYPMWSVLSHLRTHLHASLCRRVLAAAWRALAAWLRLTNAHSQPHKGSGGHASFHFPLHRHLAAFLCCGVRSLGLRAADVLPPLPALHALAQHPLSTQALFYEILAGIWVRNGLQIKGQAMTYIQANFCNSMVDMDIYWLQICAAHLPPDDFINMCIDTFNVREWLSLEPMSPAQSAEQDAMVEGLLTFLAILVSSRTNLGNDELTQSRLEVSTLLAAGDKTHSQLLELMPERSGNAHTRNFETVLKELSTYRPPPKGSENLEQGLFVPKPIVWEKYYDPLHVLRRAVHRRDYHASMDRFTAYVKEKQKAEGVSVPSTSSKADAEGTRGGSLWPPLRDPPPPPEAAGDPSNLCSSGVLCGAVVAVLVRYSAGRGGAAPAPAPPPDHVLALAVYLLYTALTTANNNNNNTTASDRAASWSCVVASGVESRSAHRSQSSGVSPPLLEALRGGVCVCARTHLHTVTRTRTRTRDPPARRPPAASAGTSEWESSATQSPGRLPPPGASPPPATSTALVVPPPMQMVRRMDTDTDDQSDSGGDPPQIRSLEDSRSAILALVLQSLEDGRTDEDAQMSLAIPTTDDDTPPIHDSDFELVEPEWSLTIREESPSQTPALPAPEPTTSTDTQLQVHQDNSEDDVIVVNESIISLLLKLHSQLSGKLDSFSLDEPAPKRDLPIGDGCYWIGRLLHALCKRDRQCAECVTRVRQQLWPHQRERQAELAARERREKEERSRRARARQEAVMAEFARRQQQFLSSMNSMECGEDVETETPADYHCVICNTTALSTASHPLGRVVLLQSTSVLGHRRTNTAGGARLALNEAERTACSTSGDHTRAAHHTRHERLLQNLFSPESWVVGVSTGWSGGVQVASCGHHLHVRCLHAYLRSLTAPARPHNLHVERGEFLCPVCRQLANSVLPLSPGGGTARCRVSSSGTTHGMSHDTLAAQVQDMLDREHPHPPAATKLSEAMGKAMEEMTATAGAKLKQEYGSSPAAIFTFVASLVRTNLECELVQRGGTLVAEAAPRYKPRNECIVPLIEVVSAHARVLVAAGAQLGVAHTWRQLCGTRHGAATHTTHTTHTTRDGVTDGTAVPCAPRATPMPLLLKDPLALLMHFILLAPQNPPYLDIQHFTCIVRALYALTYYQIVCQFLARVGPGGRASMATCVEGTTPHPITQVAAYLMQALAGSELFTEDGPPTHDNVEHIEVDVLEEELQELLLPYLRICALLRQHLYEDKLPDVVSGSQEFVQLTYYLELVTEGVPPAEWSAARALPDSMPHPGLLTDLVGAAGGSQLLVRRVLSSQHVRWLQPGLVSLPRDYERLFTYYHERVCTQCGAAPKEASVCLLCGTLVCLKQSCCRKHQVCEAVQHAMECGGGTGIFLVVTSTYIIVIRGRRACLWGSLYLDDYDEEDRDLKRGKPLYLSQDRLDLLQSQWLAHRFDHTKRTWVWHRDSL